MYGSQSRYRSTRLGSITAIKQFTARLLSSGILLVAFLSLTGSAVASTQYEVTVTRPVTKVDAILLTTLTTSLGLLPMAIGIPSYSLVWGSMASTFVTGLATATILTLFIVPVFWDLLQGWLEKHQFKSGQTGTHLSDSFDSQL